MLRLRRPPDYGPGDFAAAALAAVLWTAFFPYLTLSMLVNAELYHSDVLNLLGRNWRGRDDVITKNILLLALGVLLNFLVAFGCWRAARWRQPHAREIRWFFVCWWRSCIFGTLFMPAMFFLAWLVFDDPRYGLFVWPAYLALGPALISPRVLPTRQRWRPVCPECGHTVAYAVEPRCSECGAGYPTQRPFYRRWAIRRLPWEQRQRAIPTAYLSTLLLIIFRPRQAAWRLANPDRMGRAVRWFVGHVLAGPVLLILISPLAWVFVTTLLGPRQPDPWAAAGIKLADEYDWNLVDEIAPRVAAWLVVFTYPVLLGVVLSYAHPWSHPATRRAMMKWSLYAGVVMVVLALLAFGAALYVMLATTAGFAQSWLSFPTGFRWPASHVVIRGLTLFYAAWWAIGMGVQPWQRSRGFAVFAVAFVLFVIVWRLSLWLFNTQGFEVLL